MKTGPYHLIVVSKESAAPPKHVSCATVEALEQAVADLVLNAETGGWVYCFNGERIKISTPRPQCRVLIGDDQREVTNLHEAFPEDGQFDPLRP